MNRLLAVVAFEAVLVLAGCNKIKQNVAVFNCGDAKCDYDTKMFDEQQYGVQSTLDDFRRCHDLFVQGESETQEHFVARIPETKGHLCLLYRKAVQSAPIEPGDRLGRRGDVTFMGGNFYCGGQAYRPRGCVTPLPEACDLRSPTQ